MERHTCGIFTFGWIVEKLYLTYMLLVKYKMQIAPYLHDNNIFDLFVEKWVAEEQYKCRFDFNMASIHLRSRSWNLYSIL